LSKYERGKATQADGRRAANRVLIISTPKIALIFAAIVAFAALMKFWAAVISVIVTLYGGAGSAHAQHWRGVELDPQRIIRPALLERALDSYERHAGGGVKANVLAIADFARRSSSRRFYLVDLRNGAVSSYLVAHGAGSDRNHDGIADYFSDSNGSHASTLGAFRAGGRYNGDNGLSLRLDGLDAGNRNARSRAIVVHSQWYVSDRMARAGRIGRSHGCFVVDRSKINEVVRRLEGGGFI
jgi:hypothetical protein